MPVLTPKQELFVAEYLKDLNGKQAAIRAGYSAHTAEVIASQLKARPHVADAIATARGQRSERCEIDADYVLGGIQRVAERCEQAEPVLDEEGIPIGVYRFEASSALRGYELLGKHLAMFKERLEISDLREKSEAELEEEAATLRSVPADASDLV